MIFNQLKRSGLDDTRRETPVIAMNECKTMPVAIPALAQIAMTLPNLNDCLVTNKKSGPGLATANRWSNAIVKNSSTMLFGFYFLILFQMIIRITK